jgi:DNA-directed RNA polymerase subunit RPC12/RpoP
MSPSVEFNGTYEVEPLSSLTPGGWYIGFACVQCGQHFAIMNEPTNTGQLRTSGSATFRAACPNCGEVNKRSAADLAQFQAAQGGPTSSA